MEIEKIRAQLVSSVWQAFAQSGVDLSAVPVEQQQKLVARIADTVMLTIDAMLEEGAQEGKKEPVAAGTENPEVRDGVQEEKEPETKIQEQETPALQERKELSLSITAADTTWISVRIDSNDPKEWLLKQGEKISLSASERFVIKTGNAGSTKIIFNGEDLGTLGGQGQVLEVTLPKNENE